MSDLEDFKALLHKWEVTPNEYVKTNEATRRENTFLQFRQGETPHVTGYSGFACNFQFDTETGDFLLIDCYE